MMISYCPFLLVVIAGSFHTAVSLGFTSTPGDLVVVVGYNNSNIELIWRLNLAGQSIRTATILESTTSSFSGVVHSLYEYERDPKISAEDQDRVNVTLVVDNDTVTLTMMIYNVTLSDKIFYRVETKRSDFFRSNDELVINIYVLPKVQLYSDQTTIYENQTITLHCNATGKPTPTISWKQMNHPSRSFPTGSSLIIATANETDAGEYKCIGTNSVGSDEASLNITVIPFSVPVIEFLSSNQADVIGSTIYLHCNASGFPSPTITWTKQGNDSILSTSSNLTLSQATTEDSGLYNCTATNHEGNDWKTVFVDVQFAPEISRHPQSMIVNESNSISLFCNASGNPLPEITWTKEGYANFKSTNNFLHLTNVSKSDGGIYICTASNGIGQNATANATVTIQYKPQGTVIQSNLTNNLVVRPEGVKINCTADANPAPNLYEFVSNNNKVGESSNGIFELSSTNLSFQNTIKCIPYNRYWVGQGAELVIVVHDEPNITSATSAAETWVNKEVTIQCTAEGNPRPNITWSKGSGTVGIIDTYTVQSTLRVNPTTWSDFGVYTCTANNGVGTALKNISLTQQLVPGTPIIQKTELVENKMTVRWTAPLNNGEHEIRSYEVSFSDGSGTKTCRTAANRTSCVFDTVLTLKEYSVSIKCENGVGFSNEVKVSMEVKRINMVFPAEPCDVETTTPGGKRYKEIVDAFLAEIDRVYSKSSTKLYGLSVDSLRCGSIIAVFKMSFLKNDTNYLEPLKKETANGKLGTFAVDKDSIKEYEEPVQEAGFTKFWNSLPLGAKIGLIIAFVLFIFLIVYMIVMCVIKCRQNKKSGNFGDDFAMKNYSNKAFSTDTENGLVMTKEKELQYADLAEFRNNDTQGEKLNKPTTNQPTDYAEITHFQKPPQEENNRQNGHSKQDMQTGEKRTDKNEAGSGKTTNNTAKPAYNMETISNDPGIKNNTYIPRARRWHNDDFLY